MGEGGREIRDEIRGFEMKPQTFFYGRYLTVAKSAIHRGGKTSRQHVNKQYNDKYMNKIL